MARKKTGLINDTVRNIGEGVVGAAKGAAAGFDDYLVRKGPPGTGQTKIPNPLVLGLTPAVAIAGSARGAILGAQGKYSPPKQSVDSKPAQDRSRDAKRVVSSGNAMKPMPTSMPKRKKP